VQVVEAPAASVVTGQVMVGTVSDPDGDVKVSATLSPLSVRLPVLVARKEYVTFWDDEVIVVGLADLVRLSDGDGHRHPVAVDTGEVTELPPGVVPETVAELLMTPLSMSACVTV
jgi:hypothetical protein